MSRTDALIVAAGRSRRMGGGSNKVLLELAGRPILSYSVTTLLSSPLVDRLWIVIRPEDREEVSSLLKDLLLGNRLGGIVDGGEERFDSVRNGLASMVSDPPDFVLIQDGARPFLNPDLLPLLLEGAKKGGGAVVGFPSVDSLKESEDGFTISQEINRSRVWQVQTPQAFAFDLVWSAYKGIARDGEIPTDDTAVVSRFGVRSHLVKGSQYNLKITTPEDLIIAEALIHGGCFPWL